MSTEPGLCETAAGRASSLVLSVLGRPFSLLCLHHQMAFPLCLSVYISLLDGHQSLARPIRPTLKDLILA